MKKTFVVLLAFSISGSLFAQNTIDTFFKADSLLSTDNSGDAEAYLVELIKNNPYSYDYYYDLGLIYHENGEYRKSITQFLEAHKLGEEARSNLYMARNYISLNNKDSAIYYLERHLVTPLNGPPLEGVLYDSIFNSLHDLPAYQNLLPPRITDSIDVTNNWLTDIKYLAEMLKLTHYDPFFKVDEQDWDRKIEQFKKDIPSLSNNQILVRIKQFLSQMGDGHTDLRESSTYKSIFPHNRTPFYTGLFSDGCYILRATDEYKELLGAKIIKINNIDFDSVFAQISSIISQDNENQAKFLFSWHLSNMNYLNGLGIADSEDSLEITYSMNNQVKTTKLGSVKGSYFPEFLRYHTEKKSVSPMFLENSGKAYWFKYLEDENILYAQMNVITSLPENPLEQFCDSLKTLADSIDISAFVLDIRNNTGGNSELNTITLNLLMRDNINIKGRLFTIIGNRTFSAAQNLASDIENYTETIFIGEPTGSKPNFIGEVNLFKLPFSGLVISSSNLYHQHGPYSSDTRNWIAPHVLVDFSFDDYKTGVDPVLEEIKRFVKK